MPEIGLLSAGEILMLILVHQHQGAEPLKLRRLALDLKPEVENEQRLLEVGFLADGKGSLGKPARGTVAISEEGIVAIRKNLRMVIAKLAADNTKEDLAERREQRDRVRERLMKYLDKYPGPVAKPPTGPAGVSRAEDPDDEEHETLIEPGQAAPGEEEDEEEKPVRRGLAPAKGVMQGAADKGVIKKLNRPVLGGGKKAPPKRNRPK